MSEKPEDVESCYKCGGRVETEIVGDYRDWVCQKCGIVVYSGLVVEDQQEVGVGDDFEVME